MRRIVLISVLILVGRCALAQTYGRLDFSLQNAMGQAIAGATVTVYTQAACGTPTTGTVATLYSSANGGLITAPITTDGFGHAFAYTLPGCVTVTYSSPFTGTLTYQDQTVNTFSVATIPGTIGCVPYYISTSEIGGCGGLPLAGGIMNGAIAFSPSNAGDTTLANLHGISSTQSAPQTMTGPLDSYSRVTPTFDVRAYGAICNGSSANAAADLAGINAAIAAAVSAGGGIVTGPAKTSCYKTAGTPINIGGSNITLRGFSVVSASADTQDMIQTNGGAYGTACSTQVSNIKIEGMILNGARSTSLGQANGIDLYCATNSHVDHSTITNVGWEGIFVLDTTSSNITSTNFAGVVGDCVHVDGGSIFPSSNIGLTNNVCDQTGVTSPDGGFAIDNGTFYATTANNTYMGGSGTAFGFECAGCHDSTFTGNVADIGTSSNDAYRILVGTADAYSVIFSGNAAILGAHANNSGFNCTNANASHSAFPIKFIGNTVRGPSSTSGNIGFYSTSCKSVEIENNHISMTASSSVGIDMDVGNSSLLIADNWMEGVASGITLASSNAGLVRHNAYSGVTTHIADSSGGGVFIEPQVVQTVTQTTNLCTVTTGGTSCNFTLTWPYAFPDTNYTYVCQQGLGTAIGTISGENTKNAGSVGLAFYSPSSSNTLTKVYCTGYDY